MTMHNPLLRLGITADEAQFEPVIQNKPPLPPIDWPQVGQQAPTLSNALVDSLPKANAVVITWASAEWAALQHVFCASSKSMPYNERSTGTWPGWQKYDKGLAAGGPASWTYWGYYRLVQIKGRNVLLFKSNTHLDWPGSSYLQSLIKIIIKQVQPSLILSIGTAGGGKPADHIGTVRAVSAGTLYVGGQPSNEWPIYANSWNALSDVLSNPGFAKLMFAIPTIASDLQAILSQFNQFYGTNFSLADVDPNDLNMGDPTPQIDNQTGGAASLLTTPTFVVGNTSGDFENYVCIEMDDAVIGEVCKAEDVPFGFIRNISDPVQNPALPTKVQGNWGGAIYNAYGFYTSYNGALTAWAILAS
jgi:nucleoside phosphorylase